MENYKSKEPGKSFSITLLRWNQQENDREMPWKGEKDPYRIWVSEIILQQTRVDQGLSYYQRFIKAFPDVLTLASAAESQVFKLWEGLGYYSRCRNLIATAKFIANDLNGKFPDQYENIKSLKGIGPYTAAAISSFAYNLPYAVVDGNVFRVISRIFGIAKPIDSTEGKKLFTELAQQLLDTKNAGIYNQAIMDFGATVCKPALPVCDTCPFNNKCIAYQKAMVATLPIKEKSIKIKKRWFYYFVIEKDGATFIRQRTAKDIWQQLYEFPMVETNAETDIQLVLKEGESNGLLTKNHYKVQSISPTFSQKLSHQTITGKFIVVELKKIPAKVSAGSWVNKKNVADYAFPKIINAFLDNRSVK